MNLLHPSAKILSAVLAAFALATTAWGLPPIGKEIKLDPTIKGAAAGEETLKHGMNLIVNLKDKGRVRGTLVWADESAGYLLIRPRPGAAPRKILDKDIEGIDRIRLTNSAGDVTPDQPEIHQASVINGSMSKVQYFAPTISSAERNRLVDLEIAQNEMSRAEYMMAQVTQSLRNEIEAMKADLTYQDMRNKLITQYAMYAMYPSAGYYNPIWFGTGFGFGNPWFYHGYGASVGQLGNYQGTNAGKVFETLLTREVTLGNHLANARRTLAQAQRYGLYQGDRLVAVVVDDAPDSAVRPAVAK